MTSNVFGLVELSKDVLCKNLSELDTHLVCTAARRVGRTHVIVSVQQTNVWHSERTERVDAPNDTLREDLMFVECDECTERRRCNLGDQDAVAWAVAFEDFGFDECFGSVWAHFLQTYPVNRQSSFGNENENEQRALRTCSSVLPKARASGWAKKLLRRMRWCLEFAMGLWVVAGAMKSAGMSFVP